MSVRTGGREAVEDTPVTGATDEQIRNAKELIYVNVPINQELAIRKSVNLVARYLVPVGYVIVRAEDALTAEDRTAAAQLVDTHFSDYLETAIDEEPDVFHRMNLRDSLDSLNNLLRTIAAGGQA